MMPDANGNPVALIDNLPTHSVARTDLSAFTGRMSTDLGKTLSRSPNRLRRSVVTPVPDREDDLKGRVAMVVPPI